MLSLDKIYQAAFVLKQVARKTDLIYAQKLTCDNQIYLKTENLQVTGSFKLRGAYYKISQLTDEQRAAGILACSAGNHAQGVALAATRMGAKSVICMPDGAPISKVEATRALGAEVCLVPGAYDDAYEHARRLEAETHATFIHPFNDEEVIAGQGTIGLEILEQLADRRRRTDRGRGVCHQGTAPRRQGVRRAGRERVCHGAEPARTQAHVAGPRGDLCRRYCRQGAG